MKTLTEFIELHKNRRPKIKVEKLNGATAVHLPAEFSDCNDWIYTWKDDGTFVGVANEIKYSKNK